MTETTTMTPELIIGIDGSKESLGALREGLTLAAAMGYRARVICAWNWPMGQGMAMTPPIYWDPEGDAREILTTALAAVDIPEGLAVSAETAHGDAADVLIAASAHARMLVTGSTGAGMARALLLGSVSTKCAQRAACPVLVYRPMPGELAAGAALAADELLTAG
jgi:nucleotide-binding universal stress UspA family protein